MGYAARHSAMNNAIVIVMCTVHLFEKGFNNRILLFDLCEEIFAFAKGDERKR